MLNNNFSNKDKCFILCPKIVNNLISLTRERLLFVFSRIEILPYFHTIGYTCYPKYVSITSTYKTTDYADHSATNLHVLPCVTVLEKLINVMENFSISHVTWLFSPQSLFSKRNCIDSPFGCDPWTPQKLVNILRLPKLFS